MRLKELAELQNGYLNLLKNGITKKAMCDLVIPFRDKWGLSDKQALMIARNEICLDEISKLMNNPQKTNADRIRAMSDEEQKDFILAVHLGYSPWCDHHCENEGDDGCDRCIGNWLQQPAEEVHNAKENNNRIE